MKLNIVPSALGDRAVPTNQWWTRVVVDDHVGALWVCPLMVEPKPESVDVFFPTEWNGDGRTMVKGSPLRVRGVAQEKDELKAQAPSEDDPIVLADFEKEAYPEGWKTTGEAFGARPAQGPNPTQSPVNGYAGKGLANSYFPNDSSVGTMRSPEFTIERDFLHFLAAGGNDAEKLSVNLLIDGEVAMTVTGKNSNNLEAVTWDLKSLRGKKAVLELVDESTGGWGHILADHFVLDNKETPAAAPSRFVRAESSQALRWGDWTMSFRQASAEGNGYDITLGRGMPLVWLECLEVSPVLEIPEDAVFTDTEGKELEAEEIKGSFIVTFGEKSFGVHLPEGSETSWEKGLMSLTLPAAAPYFSLSALPDPSSFEKLAPAAFNIPRGSQVEYDYTPEQAAVTTQWKVDVESLAGEPKIAVTGWLPHHLRNTQQSLSFNGLEYAAPRGKIRCATGTEFELEFPFEGLVPSLPMPATQVENYDPERLNTLLEDYTGKVKFGGDTYWGGKDLLRCAQAALLAKQTSHPRADDLREKLKGGLTNWFTWTPGEKSHYFSWYPKWQGLVGFKDSYGSFKFTDQHFHFGYFTTSSTIMAILDPQFLDEYGEMACLVAKGYANWDKEDSRFPRFRTFDFWEGHSWAGGFSSPGGNNQESSSEAIQSWAGIFLLGSVRGDEDMQAAGAMGYAMERASTMDYWLDQPGFHGGEEQSSLPTPYKKSVTGILFANGIAYATYFSGDPAWIHGIQWFPPSPWQDHLASDPPLTRHLFSSMMTERAAWFEKEAEKNPEKKGLDAGSVDKMGGALGNVIMGFLSLSDPARALTKSNELAKEGSQVVKDPNHIVPLAHAASRVKLGNRVFNAHTSLPTSACFEQDGEINAVLFNPESEPFVAKVYVDGKAVSEVEVPPGDLLVHPVQLPNTKN